MTHPTSDLITLLEEREHRRAAKLRQFFALLRDPDISPDIADVVASLRNGNGAAHKPAQAVEDAGAKPTGGIRDTIRQIAGNLPPRFDWTHVDEQMQRVSFDFGKTAPKQAIVDALYVMSRPDESPVFRQVTKGRAGKPNTYERI